LPALIRLIGEKLLKLPIKESASGIDFYKFYYVKMMPGVK
jgi:hypothetical protein